MPDSIPETVSAPLEYAAPAATNAHLLLIIHINSIYTCRYYNLGPCLGTYYILCQYNLETGRSGGIFPPLGVGSDPVRALCGLCFRSLPDCVGFSG